jgi:hypothetical protein
MKNPLTPLFRGSPARQHLAWTIFIGILVAVLALLGGGRKIVEAYEGLASADTMTRISAALSGAEERAIPVTLVAVDDETRAKWGNPVITPHAALAQLIRIASDKGAKGILVDIDLSSDVPDMPPDPVLYNEIAHAPADGPPLMLVRSIRFRAEQGDGHERRFTADSVRRTPYDRLIADTLKAQWVSALPVFTGDRVVRKVRLWQSVCDGANGTIYPSPALLVAATKAGGGRRNDLAQFLTSKIETDCGGAPPRETLWPKRHASDVALQFVIGAGPDDAAGKTTESNGKTVPLFRQLGAWTLLIVAGDRISPAGDIDEAPFRNRVVVIGATHADSRDFYATPLGSQSGAMILANVVAGAPLLVSMRELSVFAESAIAVLLFVVFATIGRQLHLTIATIVVGLLAGVMVVGLSRQIGFDSTIRIVALALTLYALHHVVNSLTGIAIAWRSGVGWRALLARKSGH